MARQIIYFCTSCNVPRTWKDGGLCPTCKFEYRKRYKGIYKYKNTVTKAHTSSTKKRKLQADEIIAWVDKMISQNFYASWQDIFVDMLDIYDLITPKRDFSAAETAGSQLQHMWDKLYQFHQDPNFQKEYLNPKDLKKQKYQKVRTCQKCQKESIMSTNTCRKCSYKIILRSNSQQL